MNHSENVLMAKKHRKGEGHEATLVHVCLRPSTRSRICLLQPGPGEVGI